MTAEEQPPLLCTPEILREQRIDSRPDTAAKRLASRQQELVVMDGSTVRYMTGSCSPPGQPPDPGRFLVDGTPM